MKSVLGITLFASLALAAGSSSSYNVTLSERAVIAGKELKPGDYTVEVNGGQAVIKKGKESVAAPVSVQSGDQKFSRTSIRYDRADGQYHLDQIQIGGTKTTLVFGKESGTQVNKPAEVR
ncbi:MAG: hypothetical protein JO307_22050 [Bryobacterales bacterium]|nr:hypothetical protein [Bryobacterales bacterium]MBV9397786.1 hypothetical protein [Bryobacterales bacterium]